MGAYLSGLFASDGFLPHGLCLSWDPALIWLHVLSDGLIALAYYSIPAALLVFAMRRQDVPFHWVFLLFGAFILACGTTHVLGVVTLWQPVYALDGLVKALTAAVSVPVAATLWWLMPRALALPGLQQLADANQALTRQAAERDQADRQIREINASLDERVRQRTAELAAANEALRREVDERKRAEQRAADAHARLVDAIEAIPGSFRLFDKDERLVIANARRWTNDTERLPPLAPGARFEDLVRAAADQQLARASIDRKDEWVRERMAEFRRGDTTAEIEWNDGRWVQLLERRTSDGGTVSLRFDITERKRTEEQLRRAQRLESVGQLTGGIAHDFNNLLAVIIGNLEMAGEDHVAQDIKRELLSQALQAALRGAELTQRLLAFSRRQPLNPRAVDIEETILSMRELLRRTLGETITVDIAARERPWPCLADPVQLESALLNLAINARDAMPEGGRIVIETANVTLDANAVGQQGEIAPGEYTVVSVTDTGTGMSEEVRRHAFEPFFTTKDVGKGSGLGLSMVYGFVKQSGGNVTIYSEPGHGTTVKLYLPRARPAAGAGEASASAAATTPAPSTSPAGTVLVVEDQDEVRVLVERQFTALGFTVHQAADAAAALAMLEAHPEIALLFTDIILPGGMTGLQLAEEALRRWPALKVLYTSGYTESAVAQRGGLESGALLLSKPYRKEELRRMVRLVLQQA
jgi:signal transduction histidine kinase/CheY-like chemotaxis protein